MERKPSELKGWEVDKKEMEALLNQQVLAFGDFVNGYKACAKFVLEAFDKKASDGNGTKANEGNSEGA